MCISPTLIGQIVEDVTNNRDSTHQLNKVTASKQDHNNKQDNDFAENF